MLSGFTKGTGREKGRFAYFLSWFKQILFQILPKRLDWNGTEHDQSYQELVGSLPPHLLKK